MELNFRQGLARVQTDITSAPNFLQISGSTVSLIVSPDSTIVSFAHGTTDYLFEERRTVSSAWAGPFFPATDYWLYWDIDILTGLRAFNHTLLEPVYGSVAPVTPAVDQHWFDTTNTVMNAWNGTRWVEKIRCFAAKFDEGSVLIQYGIGTQVGITTPVSAGFILFDDDDHPVKKFDRYNRGKFITTETPLASQVSQVTNFKLEAQLEQVEAMEYIPAYSAVAFKAQYKVGLASSTNFNQPAVGIVVEDMFISEVRTFISTGFVRNVAWNWTVVSGTPVFVGSTGALTTTVPQINSIQQIGYVVNPTTLFIQIHPLIKYA